jgi:hypothetical protein
LRTVKHGLDTTHFIGRHESLQIEDQFVLWG